MDLPVDDEAARQGQDEEPGGHGQRLPVDDEVARQEQDEEPGGRGQRVLSAVDLIGLDHSYGSMNQSSPRPALHGPPVNQSSPLAGLSSTTSERGAGAPASALPVVQLDHSYGAPNRSDSTGSCSRQVERVPSATVRRQRDDSNDEDDLEGYTLPAKRRPGRQRVCRKLDHHANHPAPFLSKTITQRKKSIISLKFYFK